DARSFAHFQLFETGPDAVGTVAPAGGRGTASGSTSLRATAVKQLTEHRCLQNLSEKEIVSRPSGDAKSKGLVLLGPRAGPGAAPPRFRPVADASQIEGVGGCPNDSAWARRFRMAFHGRGAADGTSRGEGRRLRRRAFLRISPPLAPESNSAGQVFLGFFCWS